MYLLWQVAYMMDSRLKDGHFIRHLALLRGGTRAGMSAMYTALNPAESTEPTAVSLIPECRPAELLSSLQQLPASTKEILAPGQHPVTSEKRASSGSKAIATAAMKSLQATWQKLDEIGEDAGDSRCEHIAHQPSSPPPLPPPHHPI